MPTISDPFEAQKFFWQEGAEELLAVVERVVTPDIIIHT